MSERRELVGDARAWTLQDVADTLGVGLLTLDRQLVVTAWSEWLERVSGKPAFDVVGRHIAEVEPGLGAGERAALEQAVNGATVVLSQPLHKYLLAFPAPGGYPGFSHMQQSVRLVPVRDADGTPQGAVAIINDVTEHVAREEELRAAMLAAQDANRAKSEFLAAMSHELRTPIGSMLGYADLVAEGIFGPIEAVQRDPLLRIKSVGGHLLAIVEQILTYARIEAGREVAVLAPTDASQLLRQAVQAVEPLATKKGLALVTLAPDSPLEMNTDSTKVRQILINLLGNAIKFTERGTITAGLSLTDCSTVSFAIRDTGPGIAREDHARVFEPFVQTDQSTTRIHSGTGLGLSVSRELARLLGGDITLSSDLGAGSVFTVTLPR